MNTIAAIMHEIIEQSTPWRLHQVLQATGGRHVAGPAVEPVFAAVSTDSRTIKHGELFVALVGERHNGVEYIDAAVRQGALGVMLPESINRHKRLATLSAQVTVIAVADTLTALGDLAAFRRRRFSRLQVLAITGSSGKTTVKEMCAAVLEKKITIIKTKGNFNNLIGLPLSLLPVDERHQVAVLEMGMNQPGEIARLARIAGPDISCIVNIHGTHLEGLGSINGVARAKNELFDNTRDTGTLVINLDDPLIRGLAKRHSQRQISFGLHREAHVRASHIISLGAKGAVFTLHIGSDQHRVKLRAPGRHNVSNGLAAAAMAHALGMSLGDICMGLESFQPCDKRSQIEALASGPQVINDCYNANPASVQAALSMLQDLGRGHRQAAVLGDMLELGPTGPAAHRRIGASIAHLGIDYLATYGDLGALIVAAARQQGMDPSRARAFSDKESLLDWLTALIKQQKLSRNDWLLIKGSRSMRMEIVFETLRKNEGSSHESLSHRK